MIKKKIIFTCDDLGICETTNNTILECMKDGLASSASLLVNTPSYLHALNKVVPLFNGKIGIHLNLTIGKSILNYTKVPNIVNSEGYFSKKSYFFYLLNFMNKNKIHRQIYRELSAQIKKAKKDGIKISHLDSQEHIHMSPLIFKIFTRLQEENKIRNIRTVNEKIIFKEFYKNFIFKVINLNYFKFFLILVCNCFNKTKKTTTRKFYSIVNIGLITKDNIINLLQSDYELTEVSFHPGEIIDDKYYKRYNYNTYMFLKSTNRLLEKKTLLDTNESKDTIS